MGAPWAPHTLNDSASELFLHWLVGWVVGWLFGWLIDVNWLVGWLFQTYAMIRAPINSITLVE
jgi:F0F1-type ATP synthase assembly protein I